MSFRPSALLVVGLGVFLLALALYLGEKSFSVADPPVISEQPKKAQDQAPDPSPSIEILSGPWFQMPMRSSAPQPSQTPVRADTSTVIFLGSSTDTSGRPTYFFKNSLSGQVILLAQGETKKGWTLKTISDRTFTISGPGGIYEVMR